MIKQETFNAIINYLVNQPYNQVSGLIEIPQAQPLS